MSDKMTADNLKKAYPDVYGAIEKDAYDRGFETGQAQGKSAGILEGAESERTRIKSVEDASLAGHEELVASLKYDGVTTGPEAAVKVLQAEKSLRAIKLAAFTEEHTTLAAAAIPKDIKAEEQSDDASLPPKERAKKTWDADPAVRAEFKNDSNAYEAFVVHEAAGQVKIYRGGN